MLIGPLIHMTKSTYGICIIFGNNPVVYGFRKKSIISGSSIEVEYRALALGVAEVLWLKSLLNQLNFFVKQAPMIWCNNFSVVHLNANPILYARTKRVETGIYFVRDPSWLKRLICNNYHFQHQLKQMLSLQKPFLHNLFSDYISSSMFFQLHPLACMGF